MRRASKRSRGSVLLYALIVLLVGGTLLAGWVSFMGSRMLYIREVQKSINRRIALDNSRSLATEYFLENLLPGSITAGSVSTATSQWGGFSLTFSGTTVVPLTTTNPQQTANIFAPGGGAGYEQIMEVFLSDGVSTYPWYFICKSRSPILSYDLYTQELAAVPLDTTANTTNITVTGAAAADGANAVIWPIDTRYYNINARTYQALSATNVLHKPGGTVQADMLNFPFPPVTSGSNSSNLGYGAYLSVIGPTEHQSGIPQANSLLTRAGWLPGGWVTGSFSVYRPGTGSGVNAFPSATYPPTVNANNDTTASPVDGVSTTGTASGTPNVVTINLLTTQPKIFIYNNAAEIVLQGQVASNATDLNTADTRPALLIVYVEDASCLVHLSKLTLKDSNNRRVYLAIKRTTASPAITVTCTPANPVTWRLAGVFENSTLIWSLGTNGLTLKGGIRTDSAVQVTGTTAALSIIREPLPKGLESLADRIGWLEAFKE